MKNQLGKKIDKQTGRCNTIKYDIVTSFQDAAYKLNLTVGTEAGAIVGAFAAPSYQAAVLEFINAISKIQKENKNV